jgi:hypothetical protein
MPYETLINFDYLYCMHVNTYFIIIINHTGFDRSRDSRLNSLLDRLEERRHRNRLIHYFDQTGSEPVTGISGSLVDHTGDERTPGYGRRQRVEKFRRFFDLFCFPANFVKFPEIHYYLMNFYITFLLKFYFANHISITFLLRLFSSNTESN